MKIFPSAKYEFKLIDNQTETLERLARKTEQSQKLVSRITDKSFIGIIQQNHFRVISSTVGKGAFLILDGIINDEIGEVAIEINTPFKILCSLLMLLPFIALIIQLITQYSEFNPIMILVCIGQILVVRYFIIGLFFKIISKQSINKLSDVLDTEWITKK